MCNFSLNLIEIEIVQNVGELAVLLCLLQLNKMLLQPMQSQLRVVVNKNFHGLKIRTNKNNQRSS